MLFSDVFLLKSHDCKNSFLSILQGISYWNVTIELLWQIEICKLEFGWRGFWNPEGWLFQFHQPVFIKAISVDLNSLRQKRTWMTEVFSKDFPGLRTSAASMTSTASTTSMASMTSTASFHQKNCWSWWLDHSWHKNDQ